MLTPSGILGLMSCKMRWLQLTCTDAHTSLPHPLPALLLAPHVILLQILSSACSRSTLSGPRPTASSASDAETLPHLFTEAPQAVRNGELRLHTTFASVLPPTLQVALESMSWKLG